MSSSPSYETGSSSSPLRRLSAWLLAATVAFSLGYSWMSPQVTAPNERTRLYLTLSLLEAGTVSVDSQVARYGRPYDIARHDGHYFTDKAPGAAVLAVPFFAVYRALGGSDSIEKMTLFARSFVMVPVSVLGVMLAWAIMLRLGLSRATATTAALAFALGTSFFHYGAAFYGHALATTASLAAAYAIFRALDAKLASASAGWRFVAGLAGGAAFAFEYQAVVLCVALALGYLAQREHRALAALVPPLAGAAIPVALTLVYNAVAFGGPLETGYSHLIHAHVQSRHDEGLFGVRTPAAEAVYGLLLGPSRGLLWCAPVVLLGYFGFGALWRRARWLAVYAATSMLGYLLLMSGAEVWYAGWSFGPRLLVPIFGLAALCGAALLEERTSRAWHGALRGYLAAGMAYNVFVASMFPEIPHAIRAPLRTAALPLAELGQPSPNLGMTWLGLDGMASLAPLYLVVALAIAYVAWAGLRSAVGALHRTSAVALISAIFFIATWAYPETEDEQAARRWVRHVASMRVQPR